MSRRASAERTHKRIKVSADQQVARLGTQSRPGRSATAQRVAVRVKDGLARLVSSVRRSPVLHGDGVLLSRTEPSLLVDGRPRQQGVPLPSPFPPPPHPPSGVASLVLSRLTMSEVVWCLSESSKAIAQRGKRALDGLGPLNGASQELNTFSPLYLFSYM